MYQYAWLVYNITLSFLWLILFLKRKDLRQEMLFMGFLVGIVGPISEFWYKDYWQPAYAFGFIPRLEDFLFGFFIGGIGATIYEEIFAKKLIKRTGRVPHWLMWSLACAVVAILIIFNNILGINSIYASFIAFILLIFVIWRRRPDLIQDSILSGVFLAVISIIFYLFYLRIYPNIIQDWWRLDNISGIFVLGIPIEEPIWFFLWGMVGGPLYEFWKGYRLQ